MTSGITVPTMAWVMATLLVICCRKLSQLEPWATSCAPMVAVSRPLLTPTTMGVPTAPKDTGVLCTSMPISTAAMAGKPMATSRGAAIAAGVPKPEAPSMKQPNSQAMMMAWMRRSGLMVVKPARMAVMPPECFKVFSSRMAPKMIHNRPRVITRPCSVEAMIRLKVMSQTNSPMAVVNRYTSGMARLAGQRSPISMTAASRMGVKAKSASSPLDMSGSPCSSVQMGPGADHGIVMERTHA